MNAGCVDAWLYAADDPKPARSRALKKVPPRDDFCPHRQRHPEIGRSPHLFTKEACGRHANNGDWRAADPDDLAEDSRVSSEPPLPVAITGDRDRTLTRRLSSSTVKVRPIAAWRPRIEKYEPDTSETSVGSRTPF
jgi:hypothetical protein